MTGIIGNQQQQQQQQQNQQQQQQQIYDGVLYCWGEKYSSKPSFNAVVPNIVSLQSGFTHSLALTQEGEVYAWGDNRSSQLGVTNDVLNRVNVGRPRTVTASGSSSPFTHSPVPILLSMSTFGGQRVRMIAAGGCYSAAVLENGLLYTWGTLDDTQSSKSLATPTKVDLLKGVICVALGLNHVAVVAETNTPEKRAVYTWGSNRKGQLGVVGDSITSAPRKVTLGARALTVSCGDEFTAAIVEGNEVFVWGNNRGRQIASNNTDDVLTIPVKPFLGRDIVELSCSRNYIAARSGGGAVYIWGNNEHVCRAGDNDKTHTIPSGCRVKQISAGLTHLLALTEKGEVYVLGSGDDGQLGALEDKKSTSTFKKIAALEGRTAHFVHAWARCSSAVLEPGNFRVEISETMRRQENRTSIAPYFLRRLVHYIRGDNSKQEGIFRLSGSKARVDELERRLDLNEQFSISAKYEIYDAADNMKRYFKSLPEPICTNSLCARFERQIINTDDLQEKKTMIKEWISLLPKENRVLLIYLLSFLGEVVETQTKHMGTNAMGAKNLALVFAPNLLTKGEIGNDDVIEVMINMFDEIIADYPELESSLIIDQAEDGLAYQSVAKVPYIIELWSRTMAARESAKRAFFEPAVLTFIIDAIVEGSIESRGGNANRSRSSSFNLGNGNGAPANGSLSASGNTPPSQSPMHSPKRVSSSQYKPINGNTSPILYGSHSSPQLISTTPLVQFSTSLNSSTSGIYHSSNSNNQHISQAELQRNYEQILSLVLSPIISIKNLLRVLPSIVEIDVNSLLIKLLLANKFVRCITNNLSNTMNDSINQIKDIVDISQYNEKIKQLNSTFESLTSDVMFIEESLSYWRKQSQSITMYANSILEYFKWWNTMQLKQLSDVEEKVLRWKKDYDKSETEKLKLEKQLGQLETKLKDCSNNNSAQQSATDYESPKIKLEFEMWCINNQILTVIDKMDYNSTQMHRFMQDKTALQSCVDQFKPHYLVVEDFVNSTNTNLANHLKSLETYLVDAQQHFPTLSNQYFDLVFKFHTASQNNSKDTINKLAAYFNKPSPLISLELETKYNSIKKL